VARLAIPAEAAREGLPRLTRGLAHQLDHVAQDRELALRHPTFEGQGPRSAEPHGVPIGILGYPARAQLSQVLAERTGNSASVSPPIQSGHSPARRNTSSAGCPVRASVLLIDRIAPARARGMRTMGAA